jgi:hypothetical protein
MSFVNPLFLIGTLAAAVPILLHLVRREHAQKMEFPTLMFLRRISKRTIRYQKLRRLLLLLLRILAFLFIVFAFMRPYRERIHAGTAVGRVPGVQVIVLDNSMSMGYQNRWERAKGAAADIVRRSGAGDKFAILEFSDKTIVQTQLTIDSSDAINQIENGLELSDQPTRYAQALKIAEKVALDAGAGKRVIHLISDFQKNGWAAEEQEFRLGAGMELQFVDVGSDEFSNLAVRDVHVIEGDQSNAPGVRIKASIGNFGTEDRRNVHVSLFMEGRLAADKRIDIAKGSSQGIEFQLPGLVAGMHAVILEVDDPNLTRDNRFYMTVDARGKTPVLAVENPNAGRRRSPSFFLAKALNVDNLSPYRLTSVSLQNLVISGSLLIWNDAPGGGTAIQKKLQDFVKSGGGLAVVLGDSASSADFNRSFGSWLPVKMSDTGSIRTRNHPAEDYVLMTDIRIDHPIFMPFGKPHSGTFSSARFFSHARVSAGSGTEVPARFDNGDPALVSINVDKGRVLIFTSSADDSSNDLPLKAVYAPFWQQVLRYLENFQERRHWLEVGDIIAPKRLLAEAAVRQAKGNLDLNEAIVILDPEKQRLSAAPGSDDIAVDTAGFYEVRTMNLNTAVAVNTVPKESDLTHGNPEEMIAGWASSKPEISFRGGQPTPEELDRSQRIWALLLVAALLFLAMESFLSNLRLTTDDLQLKTDAIGNPKS